MAKLTKIVLTGAGGNLGTELRPALAAMADELVSTDITDPPGQLAANERYVQADLGSYDQIAPLLEGADMVVHFGAIVDEKPFDDLLGPNFLGAYNIWEAAWRHGVRRVVYASSIHAVGMARTAAGIDTDAPHEADTYYGLAKCFAEDLGRMYWNKRGIEAVCLRILSCTREPQNVRALGTWLSYGDMVHLVERAILAPTVEFTIAYGVSNNDRAPVSNHKVGFLGYRPKDNAEDWAEALMAKEDYPAPDDMGLTRVGGPFATVALGQSGVDLVNKMGKKDG